MEVKSSLATCDMALIQKTASSDAIHSIAMPSALNPEMTLRLTDAYYRRREQLVDEALVIGGQLQHYQQRGE
eukprot:6470464-Amphidinium_carterae.1